MTDALKAILTDRPIAYYPGIAKALGDIKAALFLGQLAYWTPKAKDPDGWVYKTQVEWEDETALTRREQEHSRGILKERGILQEKRISVPARLYYRIDFDALARLLSSANQNGETCQSIPEITTEITTETTTHVSDSSTDVLESELSPHLEVFQQVQELRGYPSGNAGAEGRAVKTMLKQGYTPYEIVQCYSHLKGEHFWTMRNLPLMTVATQIGEWRKWKDRSPPSPKPPSPVDDRDKFVQMRDEQTARQAQA